MSNVSYALTRYPHIRFLKHWELSRAVVYQLGECEAIISAICEMPIHPQHHERLLYVSLVKGAQATTAIEGNTLTNEEVERVAEGESLAPSKEYQEREVRNILDAMNSILHEVVDGRAALITSALIASFHKQVGKELGEHFDAIPGQLRTDDRVVGPYKCPRPDDVVPLVERLCEWLQEQFRYSSGEQGFSDAVVQAIVTHVYVEWIHPFGDGNGRTGRLLEFYILLRAGNPDIASHILSNFYNETRAEYYRQLDSANKARDLSAFIAYAVQGYRDGLRETLSTIQRSQFEIGWRNLIYDRFASHRYRKKNVFKRRRDLVLNLPLDQDLSMDDLLTLTPALARDYSSLTKRTLLRDLKVLIGMGLVITENGRYRVNTALLRRQMPRRRVRASPESSSVAPQV